MKITDVRVVSKDFPGVSPMVEVTTDEGITGIGATAAPTAPLTALIEEGPDSLRNKLIGEDPTQTNTLWRKMFLGGERGRGGEGGLAVNAMSAVDIALWDIAGKARGVPIYKLLGGAAQTEVMVYASTSATSRHTTTGPRSMWVRKTADQMVQECKEHVAAGFKAIKYGWGNRFAPADLDALGAVREAIGPDIR